MDLIDNIFKFLSRYNTKTSTHTFGVFRIFFGLHLLLIISQVFQYRELIFEAVPGVSKSIFPALLFVFIWSIAVLFLLFGLKTRFAAIVNYACVVIATALFTNSNVGTFNDDLLRIGSFLCLFMPVSRSFSIDSILHALAYKNPKPQVTSYLFYIIAIFLSLGLLYFPSGLTKTYSPMWVNGLGLWTPLNIPHNHWNNLAHYIINQYPLLLTINYGVILWELLFIFILFIPKLHTYIVIPGILFHIGIALLFPFPAVCTGPLVFYILFIPASFWTYLSSKLEVHKKQLIHYNPSNDLQVRLMRLLVAHDYKNQFQFIEDNHAQFTFTAFVACLKQYSLYQPVAAFINVKPIKQILKNIHFYWMSSLQERNNFIFKSTLKYTLLIYFTLFCVVMQLGISSYHIYSHYHAGLEKRMEYMRMRKSGYDLSMKPTNLVRTFLGINSRGLFLDHANTGQKTTYAITYFNNQGEEIWLPMMDQNGYVKSELNMNMAWAKVTFNLLGFSTSRADSNGIKLLTRFWANHHHQSLQNLKMAIYGKTYTYPLVFEKDYYLKLEQLKWEKEGDILWKDGGFSYTPTIRDTIN